MDHGFWITTQWLPDYHEVQMDYDIIIVQCLASAPYQVLDGGIMVFG